MEEMKEKAQKLILGDDLDEREKNAQVNAHNSNADEGYFNTYSHFAIHHEMLNVSSLTVQDILRMILTIPRICWDIFRTIY